MQINSCKDLIAQYDFLDLVGIYHEDNVSGMFTEGRTEYLKIMSLAEKQEIDVIVVMKLDRMARDLSDSATTIKLLEMYGTYLIAGDDVGNSTTPAGEFLRSILLAQGQYHARRVASDVMTAECNNARKGLTSGGIAPYGLQIVCKKYEINPNEAPAVKKMFQMTKEGRSYSEIADELFALGYTTRSGEKFCNSTINTILHNDKYYGTLIYNREGSPRKKNRVLREQFDEICHTTAIDPIISKELFDSVQVILEYRKTHSIPRQNANPEYFLTGYIFCKECGKPMHGNTTKSGRNKNIQRYYVCPNHTKSKTCDTKNVNAEYIGTAIKEAITAYVNEYISKTNLSKSAFTTLKNDANDDLRKLQSDYKAIDRKITTFLEQAENNSNSPKLAKRYKADAEKYIEMLEIKQQKIDELNGKLVFIAELEEKFNKEKHLLGIDELFISNKQARLLCSLFIDKIEIDDSNDNIEIVLK